MAKPPFQFKPAKSSLPKGGEQGVQLTGTDEAVASYSDIFVVANEAETHMASIYFYQRQLADREVFLGRTEKGLQPKAKCLARIIMSAPGIQALLEALAQNRGFTLTPINEEKK
jgi:hypothetical protein